MCTLTVVLSVTSIVWYASLYVVTISSPDPNSNSSCVCSRQIVPARETGPWSQTRVRWTSRVDGSVCSARRAATICHPHHRAVLQLAAGVFRLLGGRPWPRCHSHQVLRGCFRPRIQCRSLKCLVVGQSQLPGLRSLCQHCRVCALPRLWAYSVRTGHVPRRAQSTMGHFDFDILSVSTYHSRETLVPARIM